jgi:hypothetical protein
VVCLNFLLLIDIWGLNTFLQAHEQFVMIVFIFATLLNIRLAVPKGADGMARTFNKGWVLRAAGQTKNPKRLLRALFVSAVTDPDGYKLVWSSA